MQTSSEIGSRKIPTIVQQQAKYSTLYHQDAKYEKKIRNDYAATGSSPLCLSSGSGEGSRPRKETKTYKYVPGSVVCLPANQRLAM
jgi:hypothetical protein